MSMRKVLLVVFVSLGIIKAFDASSMGLDIFTKEIHDFNDEKIEIALKDVVEQAVSKPNDVTAQWEAAEAHRLWSAQLRESRLIIKTDIAKTQKTQQIQLAVTGQTFAEKALALAKSDIELSKANRTLGELHSLQIDGIVTGFRQGPKARAHIQKSLSLTPDDPESMRAIALMYLHNPPISGGDVPKAIKTFTQCVEHNNQSAQYALLLAMAYKEKDESDKALQWAEKALEINPNNKNTQQFIETLKTNEK